MGLSQRGTSGSEDKVLANFRTAVRRALTHGFDADLLAEEVDEIWREEFEGEGEGEGEDE